jgi:glycosyltransferase involved in cell wall biosynthesis
MAQVLLVHPDSSRLGGIESYIQKIRPHLTITHESCGNSRRPGEKGAFLACKRILGDYLKFWIKVSRAEVRIVHLNTSLQPRMFYRDCIFFFLAKLHGKKTLVFLHGWDTRFEQNLETKKGRIFRLLYGRADAFIVLASAFAETLANWGITQTVHQEVIIIEDEVFNNIRLDDLLLQRKLAATKQLLFPSRLIRAKGIFTTIKALQLVQTNRADTGLIIAGDGEDATEARQLVSRLQLQHCRFTGIVAGEQKYALYRQAHLLCFPTEHSEGFPNTIVEAMAFGLPVLTRPVGGIKDFFVEGKHGFLSDSTNPEVFAKLIELSLEDEDRYAEIARANHRYAGEHFLASQAARRLEKIYQSL